MKAKQLLLIFLTLFIFQNSFASYTNTDTLKTIILTKKNNKVKIDIGDKIFIVKENEKGRIRGEVTNITENSFEINNKEYNFSEIKTIGAKRKLTKFKILNISIISLLSSLFLTGLSVLSAYISTFYYHNFFSFGLFTAIFLYIAAFFFILSLVFAFVILSFLSILTLFLFLKRSHNLKKWNLKVIDENEKKLYY